MPPLSLSLLEGRKEIAFSEPTMEDISEIVKASLGPLPTVCQEQVLLDLERARMQAEDNRMQAETNKTALAHSEKKRKRLEYQQEVALSHCREVRDSLTHVYDSSGGLTLHDANEWQLSAMGNSINTLTATIYEMMSDSDVE